MLDSSLGDSVDMSAALEQKHHDVHVAESRGNVQRGLLLLTRIKFQVKSINSNFSFSQSQQLICKEPFSKHFDDDGRKFLHFLAFN